MVDYAFYTTQYQGNSISETDWPTAEREASAQLTKYKRMYTVTAPDENSESMAVCAIAEAMVYNAGNGAVSSASIGSVSVSYGTVDMTEKTKMNRVYNAAALYLDFYRGVSCYC